MENKIKKENKMGTEKIWSLLLSMAIPVMLSTAVQSLYNIVDGIFVSQLGESSMAAITFANPIITVLIAIGSGIAVGMNTVLSNGLGKKDQNQIDNAASSGIWLVFIFGFISLLVGLFFPKLIMSMQTSDSNIQVSGAAYLQVYLSLGIATMFQLLFERMLISTGKTMYSMISQGVGGLLNIFLDYALIFGHFGFPELGIMGAALATVFSQSIAAIIALILNMIKNEEVNIHFRLLPQFESLKRVFIVGAPTAVILSLNSFMMISYNAVLNQFSSTAVAVFGACCRITGFFYAILNALCSATIPIIAYNYGAKNKERIDSTIRFGYYYAAILMIFGTILCFGFPEMFLRMFNATDEMIGIGVWGMRMLCCCYVLCSVRNMSSSILQALEHSVTSMFIDLSRNYLVLIPAAWLLSLTGVLDYVWLSVPVADIVSAIVGSIMMIRVYKKDVKPLSVNNFKLKN